MVPVGWQLDSAEKEEKKKEEEKFPTFSDVRPLKKEEEVTATFWTHLVLISSMNLCCC
jgi:hypothetical protein